MAQSSSRVSVYPYGLANGRLSPMVPAGLCIQGRWQVAELYVDSGAYYTLMHAQFATTFGLDFKKGRKVFVQVGDGSMIPLHLHKLPMQIGGKQFAATVGFSDRLGVRFNLLGRQGVFEHFRICFHEKRRMVTFQPVA
jgi:hypothetical protein